MAHFNLEEDIFGLVRSRNIVPKTVQKREVIQRGTPTQPASITKEQMEYDNLFKTFGDMRQDLKGLRIKFEGPIFFEYPTTSTFQLIWNQMAPPGIGKSNKKWSPRIKTSLNNLADTSPISSPMAKIKTNTNIQKTETQFTQSLEQLPTRKPQLLLIKSRLVAVDRFYRVSFTILAETTKLFRVDAARSLSIMLLSLSLFFLSVGTSS
jgi:hypothetical protein